MNRSAMKLLAGAAALGLFVAAPAVADGDGDHNPQEAKSKTQTTQDICESGDLDVDLLGDDTLWPPNHKYSPLTVQATNDDGSEIQLDTWITHDEYLASFAPQDGDEEPEEEQGSGNTVDDARPFFTSETEASPNENEHEVRAERSGRGNGRTYTINAKAQEMGGSGDSCEGSVTVEVPHDMGNGAENKRDHTE